MGVGLQHKCMHRNEKVENYLRKERASKNRVKEITREIDIRITVLTTCSVELLPLYPWLAVSTG